MGLTVLWPTMLAWIAPDLPKPARPPARKAVERGDDRLAERRFSRLVVVHDEQKAPEASSSAPPLRLVKKA